MILSEAITKRLVDKLLMEVRIAHNPHIEQAEQKKLIDELVERRRALYGPEEHGGTLDKKALETLKAQLKNNSKSVTVK